MTMRDRIIQIVNQAVLGLGVDSTGQDILISEPSNTKYGDYSANIAFSIGSKLAKSPRDVADELVALINKVINSSEDRDIDRVEVAGGGFINFYLSENMLMKTIAKINSEGDQFGKNALRNHKRVIVEYTDPNPFKAFHIGHLMSNAIGEAISRLIEFSGADVKRADYFGDVGLHVAKALWGFMAKAKEENLEIASIGRWGLEKRVEFMGQAYALGATKYEDDEMIKSEIHSLNKIIYEKSDKQVNEIYDVGRKWSLDYFETIFQKLGTHFDYYFAESEAGPVGLGVVEQGLREGFFEKSGGAVIFPGEKYGLHSRVFVNSIGLPTYEAKDLGLAKTKYEKFAYDKSIIITGNEIREYFQVVLKAMSLLYPELAEKTTHIPHGMLRLKEGKMSSRTGKVVTGESLIEEVEQKVRERMATDTGGVEEFGREEGVGIVAIGAIKYSILKQGPGKDITFDFNQSLSLEGDSGPYLQYTYARAKSVLRKMQSQIGSETISEEFVTSVNEDEREVLRMLTRFPEVVEDAASTYSPNQVCTYLFGLAQQYNSFYNAHQILSADRHQDFRVALTSATAQVIKNGLWLLGMRTVERM